MLVKLDRTDTKFEILKRARRLRNAVEQRMRKIIIAPDLTKKEQEEDRKLRLKLREKKDRGETGWYIRKGQLLRNFQQEARSST